MMCEECGERKSNIHITKVVNGHKTEIDLCDKCARDKEDLDFSFEPKLALQNFFASFLGEPWVSRKEAVHPAKIQCPTCALTFAQFSQIGRFGCSNCYQAFGDDKLKPLFRRIHGNLDHAGKVPRRLGDATRLKRDISDLKKKQKEEIKKENYEGAARIRDRIKGMEKELAAKKGGGAGE